MKQAYNNSQIACARHTRVQKRRSSGASQHDVNTAAYLLLWENVCAPGHKTYTGAQQQPVPFISAYAHGLD